jgi:hypothetical protein
MNRRAVGAVFCSLAVLLFLSRYVFALWYLGSGARGTWSATLFEGYLHYVGVAPWIMAAVFAIVGVIYLVLSGREP